MQTQVKNIDDMENKKAPEGFSSWEDYWQEKSGKKISGCANVNCSSFDDVDVAHINLVGEKQKGDFCVPLCIHCRLMHEEVFKINDEETPLVKMA